MKKALSLILVLVMLLGMMPMQVFATEGTQETEAVEVVTEPTEAPEEETTAPAEETELSEEVETEEPSDGEEETESPTEEEEEEPSELSESEEEPEVVHEHDYDAVVTDPTCTEQGYTTYTCECGDSYVDDYVDAADHNYAEGTCTVCGEADPDYSEPAWGTWVAFGTSITEDKDYMRPNATNIMGTYIPYLSELMGVDAPDANYSIGGAAFSTHLLMYIYYAKYQKNGLTYNGYTHTAIKNADLITIEGGVNDFYGSVPLGKVGDTVPYSKADSISVNPNSTNNFGGTTDGTFAGCIYAAITELRRVAPDATIVFITDNAGTGSCAATKANALGHYLHDYNDMMTAVAESMGCYVIDAGRTAGFEENLKTYLSDHIHQSEAGGEAYANAIWRGLCAIRNGEQPESGHTHRYTESVTAPTCTEQGYTTYTCACGDSYVDDYMDTTGHTYKNGICTGCGEKKPTEITLGDFAVAGVGKTALSKSDVLLSQKTLIAVPYCGATLHISVSDGYRVKVHSGNNYNNINQVSDWLSDGETYTLPLASIYMRVSIQRADGGKITLDELETADVVVSYESDSDICEDNADVAQILTNTELPVLIHLSDIHGDTIRAERAASFADFVGADALLASGDLTAYEPDDWGNALFDSIDNYPNVNFIYGIGNHDTKIAASAYYESIYNSYFKDNPDTSGGETYYYRDLADQKLRIVAVNQQEGASTTTSGGTCYSQAQVDWLVETLKTTPAGYGVVFMYHSPETTIAAAGDPNYSEFFQVGNRYDNPTNSYSEYSGTFLMDLVDAFMLRENFTWNYSEKDGTSPVTLNADFTNVAEGVEFIAHVTGHVHSDSITYLPGTACKQLLLGVTCTNSMYGEPGGYYGLADYSDLNRVGNTSAQDAFNAYIIDRENKTVRVLRVGARQTVSGDTRDDMTIPYSVPFENGEYLFDTEGLIKLDLSNVEWVNYGFQAYGVEPTYYPGQRWSTDMIFDVPYDGVTLYIKINAPYEMGIRSGKTDTSMSTNYHWLNNKELISGDKNRGYVYAIPAGHEKFILSLANVTRDGSNNVTNTNHPISFLELQAAGVEIWYRPEPAEEPNYPFNTADKVKLDLSSVEWVNYGYQPYGPEPTYHVGTRLTTNMIFDVPYEGVTFYIKINAPYELGIRSGETGTAMDTNLGWLNNKYLPSGNSNYGFAYAIPAGHHKFILTIGNVTRNSSNNVSNDRNPITLEELEAAGLEIWYVPCTHTYKNGICTVCGATQPGPVITQQPESVEQEIGKKFAVTVKAEGEGLTYQWYVKENGAKAFKVSSNKTSSYAYTMQSYMHNRQVYCVITDANGDSVQTETATITRPPMELTILQQPQDAQQEIGQKFSIKPAVQGDGLTYQWYVKESGAKAFKVSSNKTSAYAYTMQSYMKGRQVYCVITDKYGNSVTTDVATISLPPVELKILEQPSDVYAVKGEKFSISFVVQGDGLTYQWYYKESYMKDFKPSSNKTSAYAYSMQNYMDGRSVYCVITDQYGNQVTTEVVTIHVMK